MILTKNLENCEGTTCTRTRLLREQGGVFLVFKAPRGRPFGGGADLTVTGLPFP